MLKDKKAFIKEDIIEYFNIVRRYNISLYLSYYIS